MNKGGGIGDAPITSTWTESPGKNPGADTDTEIVPSGRSRVKFTDSAEKYTNRPGVALNRKSDTCQVVDCGMPIAPARISNKGVMPFPMTVVRGRRFTRTAPSTEDRETKLRLDAPRKSSA